MSYLEKSWFWILASFLLYANTLQHEYAIDDLIVVTSNKYTQQGVTAIPTIFAHSYMHGYNGREDESYRPIPLATFALEKTFFDADSSISHFIQVILYGLTILMLFKWLGSLFGPDRKVVVQVICLLFLFHPIHTEVVANVKSRDELMCALFLFASFWLFLQSIQQEHKWLLVFSALSYFGALLCKETAVAALVLFPVMLYVRGWKIAESLVKSALLFIPFVVYFGIRSLVLSDLMIEDQIDPVANSLVISSDFYDRLLNNFEIFFKYIQLSFFPVQLSWDYSIATFLSSHGITISNVLGLFILLVLLSIGVIGFVKRSFIGFGAILFFSTFVLVSNFLFLINCNLGERFLFIPVLGLIIIIVLLVDKLLNNKRYKGLKLSLFIIVLSLFCIKTVARNAEWRNNLSIYESALKVCPNSVKVHFNLGTEYLEQGLKTRGMSEKEKWFQKAVSQLLEAKRCYQHYVNIYENLGFVYAEMGKIADTRSDSLRNFHRGLSILNYATDTLKLSKQTLNQNKLYLLDQLALRSPLQKEREEYMRQIVGLMNEKEVPSAEDLKRTMFYLQRLDELAELIKTSKELMQRYPQEKALILQLSEQYFKENKPRESLQILSVYVSNQPADLSAKSNLGMLNEMLGNKSEAIRIYQEILAVDPNQEHTKALYNKLISK